MALTTVKRRETSAADLRLSEHKMLRPSHLSDAKKTTTVQTDGIDRPTEQATRLHASKKASATLANQVFNSVVTKLDLSQQNLRSPVAHALLQEYESWITRRLESIPVARRQEVAEVLADVRYFGEGHNFVGGFNQVTRRIYIRPEDKGSATALITLVHEGDHAIRSILAPLSKLTWLLGVRHALGFRSRIADLERSAHSEEYDFKEKVIEKTGGRRAFAEALVDDAGVDIHYRPALIDAIEHSTINEKAQLVLRPSSREWQNEKFCEGARRAWSGQLLQSVIEFSPAIGGVGRDEFTRLSLKNFYLKKIILEQGLKLVTLAAAAHWIIASFL
jgi:hypothetical protein